MNKTELINIVAEKTVLSKKASKAVVTALFDEIEKALVSGEKVQISGFGIFETRERGPRTGKNPQTGEKLEIAACTVPAFKAAKALKEELNK